MKTALASLALLLAGCANISCHVDWPLEVVADTVTFPYDLYKETTK